MWIFHLYLATFQQHLYMSIYLSQWLQYSRFWGSYQDFLDRGLIMLTWNLLKKGSLAVKLKTSLRKFCDRQHELVNCYGTICVTDVPFVVVIISRSPFLFHDFSQNANKCNTTSVTSGAGTIYSSGPLEFSHPTGWFTSVLFHTLPVMYGHIMCVYNDCQWVCLPRVL